MSNQQSTAWPSGQSIRLAAGRFGVRSFGAGYTKQRLENGTFCLVLEAQHVKVGKTTHWPTTGKKGRGSWRTTGFRSNAISVRRCVEHIVKDESQKLTQLLFNRQICSFLSGYLSPLSRDKESSSCVWRVFPYKMRRVTFNHPGTRPPPGDVTKTGTWQYSPLIFTPSIKWNVVKLTIRDECSMNNPLLADSLADINSASYRPIHFKWDVFQMWSSIEGVSILLVWRCQSFNTCCFIISWYAINIPCYSGRWSGTCGRADCS